jgi:hypothetical protein
VRRSLNRNLYERYSKDFKFQNSEYARHQVGPKRFGVSKLQLSSFKVGGSVGMKYGKYWFHHLQKKLIANFHVLGLFMPKNKFRAKKIPSVTRRCRSCRPGVGRNLCRRYFSRLKCYRFEILAVLRQLGWIDAPGTSYSEF